MTEAEIKEIFISAFNKLLGDKDEILENMDVIIQVLTNTTELGTQARDLAEEIAILVEMTQDLITQNALVAQDQEEYQRRYDSMVERYETKKAEYETLMAQIEAKNAKSELLRQYTVCLSEQDDYKCQYLNE